MKRQIAAFIAAFVIGVGATVHVVWWQLSHNFVNVSCSNFIYRYHHLQQCATWDKASGIVSGVDMPLILIGLFGMMGSVFWIVTRWSDRKQDREWEKITRVGVGRR